MNEQDAERIRHAIRHDQTSCRCGHLLAACADCRDWLVEHSPRIAACWADWLHFWEEDRSGVNLADLAEKDDRAYFGL